ncbi:MAG: ComEC/Rec2 family competence protein, partial [Atribacterota bacterium]
VSGQHLTILGAMLWFAFRRLRLSKRGITVITILFSLAYLVFYSLSPSAFRAFLMFSFYLTGKQLGRNTLGIHFLLTTFLTMFLLQPEILFDVGAELSFLSTAALLVFTEYTPPASSFFHQAKRYVTAGLFLSLTVSVFNLPILLGNGLSFSSLLFVSNLTILPLTGLSIMMNFIAAFFSWIPAFQRLLAFPVQWLLRIIAVLSDWHVRFIPHFYWHFDIRERCGDGILLWLGLIFFLFLVLFWKKTKILLSVGLGLISLVFLTLGIAQAPGLSLWVLDVGQGMAVCSVTGHTASVIDTGGIIRTYGNTGQSVVKPFLTYQGVSAIDFIGLTHLHQDHVAGTDSLLQGFPVKVLYSPGTYQTESGGKSLPLSDPLTLPGSEGTRWEAFPVLGHSENDQAVAYRFSGPFFSLFIPGDMEEEGIRQLLEERGAMLHSDVLVMPHHGKYLAILPSLLTRIGCTTAIISCGENTYGHPDARTLALLKSRGIPFFITREKGAVGFLWKENRWEVKQNGKDHF